MATPTKPFIAWDNRFADAVPVASSTALGAAINLTDFRPYTSWKPSALPATVTVDCGSAKPADYLAIFNHDSNGASYEVHGSNDNFESEDVTCGTYWADDDAPAILNFTSASYRFWRLAVRGCENLFQCSEEHDNAYWTKLNATVYPNATPAPFVSHESNLCLYSEQFDNAYWTKTRASITPDAALSPNGTLTADALIEDATAANSHFLTRIFTSAIGVRYTQSVFAKAKSGARGLQFYAANTSFGVNQTANFNLDTGVIINVSGGATAAMEAVGDGWYRCSMTTIAATAVGAFNCVYSLTDLTSATYTGDGTSGIYIWGAQFEDDAALSRYKETTDTAVTVASEADALIETTAATASHYINKAITTSLGERYTFSRYIKSLSGNRRVIMQVNSGGFAGIVQSATFNIATGQISGLANGATAMMVDVGDGWWRCSITTVAAIASASSNIVLYLDDGTTSTYTGDGASGVYLFGSQFEASPNPSNYIKTTTAEVESPPILSIAAIGVGLEFPTWLPYGFDPLARKVFGQTNISEQGLPLGKAVLFEQWTQQLTFQMVENSWLRSTFIPAWKAHLRHNPFLFAFDLTNYADEIYLVESDGDSRTPTSMPLRSNLQLNIKGVALP